MNDPHTLTAPQFSGRPAVRDAKWSARKTLAFVLGSCVVCWTLLIGKAALIF